MAISVTGSNFEQEVLQSTLPVVVDFWADWCGPCKMLGPVIEQLEGESTGTLKVCKLNVDEAGALAMEYGVASIPTVILFRNGAEAARSVGFLPKDALKAALKL